MPLTAFVIDDNRQIADEVCRILSLLGIRGKAAYGARSGMVALQAFKPDLVLLDINMPGVTGFDVLQYIQREPHLAGLPVVIVSSENQPDTIQRAFAEGAVAFLTKPLDLDELEATLKKLKIS